jgi:putative DNA primase/helicase
VFPCSPKDKRPVIAARDGGKGFKDATTDETKIRAWWARYPDAVPGMPTGAQTGVWVLDVDEKPGKHGRDTLGMLEDTFGALPETVETITASGGSHLYFRHPRDGRIIHNRASRLGSGAETWGAGGFPEVPFSTDTSGHLIVPDLDIRGDGGYVIVAGAIMADGRRYEWEGSSDPDEGVKVADAPEWLLALVAHDEHETTPAAAAEGGSGIQPIATGERNDHLFRLGRSLRAKGCGEAAIEAALLAENAERCVPPLPEHEVKATAKSAANKPAGTSGAGRNNITPIRDDISIPHAPPDSAEDHFQVLGHDQGSFFFLPKRAKQVVRLRPSDLGRVAPLLQLAPLQWWEREYPSETGFKGKALAQAANALIAAAYRSGVFSYDQLRGRGAWYDDGRIVIHLGDRLYVNGEFYEVGEFHDTVFVYEAKRALPADLSDPLSDSESIKLLDLCKLLSWERPLHAILAAGWITSALICGCLRWRPHGIITGPSGCGKSWTGELFQQLLGPWMIAATGETTEAGIRQTVQHDALPVTWDEAEGEDPRTMANLDRVLGLMRQASADIGGKILKGGEGGNAQSYTVKTSFLLSAIRVPMKGSADKSRVTVLSLRRNAEADRERQREETLPLANRLRTPEWAARFRARVLLNAETLRANALVFADAAGELLGNARIGDQLGPMLAGAALLASTAKISRPTADKWVRGLDLSDQVDLAEARDEEQLLAAILEAHVQVPVERTNTTATVGELIQICHKPSWDTGVIDKVSAESALGRHGIRYLGHSVAISNTHRAVHRLLRDTAWGVGWSQILKRIDGATPSEHPVWFAGAVSRAVLVPIRYFEREE